MGTNRDGMMERLVRLAVILVAINSIYGCNSDEKRLYKEAIRLKNSGMLHDSYQAFLVLEGIQTDSGKWQSRIEQLKEELYPSLYKYALSLKDEGVNESEGVEVLDRIETSDEELRLKVTDLRVGLRLILALDHWESSNYKFYKNPPPDLEYRFLYGRPDYEIIRQRDNITVPYKAVITYYMVIAEKKHNKEWVSLDSLLWPGPKKETWYYKDGEWEEE